MSVAAPAPQTRAFRWLALALVLAALATFTPLWVSLVLAAWAASIARPLLLRVSTAIGGRGRAAGVLVAGLVVALVVPLVVTVVSLSRGVVSLVKSVLSSSGARSALVSLVSGDGRVDATQSDLLKSPAKIVALVQEHGAKAFDIVGGIAGAATQAFVGFFIFLYAVYVFLVDGRDCYVWLEKHAPIPPSHLARLSAAFLETGRGLFVGVGLTGVTQGAVATGAYVALGVPRAFVLGLLTSIASVIPSVGTALVWVPVAAGLAFSGKTASAAILVGVGVLVIGSVDNILRPVFSRFGKLELSSFVLLVSIFGGLTVFGTWGFLLGPLVVRLAKEALELVRHDPSLDVLPADELRPIGVAADADAGDSTPT